jgi:hypothetical protein
MPPSRQLFIHIGLQKTGTSYLQAALLGSRAALAAHGVDLVPPTKAQAFELMLVIRNRYAARRDPVSDEKILRRFSRQLQEAEGRRAVLSQESLSAAGPRQVERLIALCGDREVHVVATARDLARQLPSSWQESVKAGGTTSYPRYLEELQELERAGSGRHPWIQLDLPQVLKRWERVVPASRIHVVTVPPSGSSTTLLLSRFASVLEVDPAHLQPEERPSNSSLGHVQAEVLRRVNAELGEGVRGSHVYGDVVKRSFGRRVLAPQASARKILVPTALRPWCDAVTARQLAELEASGYRVEGSLDDLVCADSAFADDVAEPTEDEVAASSVSALAAILTARGQAAAARRSGRIEVDEPGFLTRVRRRLTR